MSPEEVEHAYLFALAAAIEREEPEHVLLKLVSNGPQKMFYTILPLHVTAAAKGVEDGRSDGNFRV